MAADCESQACRKQRKSIQSLEYLWCQEGKHQGLATMELLEKEGWGAALQGSPASRIFSTKSKELTHRMENLCPPCFSERSLSVVSCSEFYQLMTPFSLENKPFSPCWGRAQEVGCVLKTQELVWVCSFLFPQLFPALLSPPDSWIIELYRTARIYPDLLTKEGILHWKNRCNWSSILLFDLLVVYSVNKEDWDLGAASQKPLLKRKSGYFAWLL